MWLILFCVGIFLFSLGIFGLIWSAIRLKKGRWEIPAQETVIWLRTPGRWGGRRWLAYILIGLFMAGIPYVLLMLH